MINLSRLIHPEGTSHPGDSIRYPAENAPYHFPVVVWHLTGQCSLRCRHCYAATGNAGDEISICEGEELLRLLSALRPPALLLSGGEPTQSPHFDAVLELAGALGLRVTVSTNGVEVSRVAAMAHRVSYVGVSLDGPEDLHDRFRGVSGAFAATVRGIRKLAGSCRVGLRVTLTREGIARLEETLRIVEELPVSRVCFYHFVRAGRGAEDDALLPEPTDEREAVERLIRWTEDLQPERRNLEVLTVGRAADSVLIAKHLASDGRREPAARLMGRARRPSGAGILSVRWDGTVFRNQFSWNEPLGHWHDLERIARDAEARCELDAACATCNWKARSVCAGRLVGFGGDCAEREPVR